MNFPSFRGFSNGGNRNRDDVMGPDRYTVREFYAVKVDGDYYIVRSMTRPLGEVHGPCTLKAIRQWLRKAVA